jgi:hypothetical protein
MDSGHPIFLDTVRRIYAKTLEAAALKTGADSEVDSKGNIEDNTSVLEWTGLSSPAYLC